MVVVVSKAFMRGKASPRRGGVQGALLLPCIVPTSSQPAPEPVLHTAGPVAISAGQVLLMREGRIAFAIDHARQPRLELRQKSRWGHPAVAILIGAAIILPFSWAMLQLSRTDDVGVFVSQLLLAVAICVIVSGLTLLAVFRRVRPGWVVVVRAGDRRFALPVEPEDVGPVEKLIAGFSSPPAGPTAPRENPQE